MNRVVVLLVALALMAAAVTADAPGFTTAAFTAGTSNGGSTVVASSDWTPPTVSLAQPASPIKDTVALTATAADAESGIASVAIEYQLVGAATWNRLCVVTTSPYSCAFNTKLVADGTYDLQAIATDNAGYSTTSLSVRTTVANSFTVVLAYPGDVVRGTVSLATTLLNQGTTTYTVRVEYSLAGTGSWKTLCNTLSSPYSCSWNTTAFASDFYDLRSVAVSGGSSFTSATVLDVLVDNVAPSVVLTNPGSPLGGFVTFSATATDAGSGVARADLQYALSGSTTFATFCSVTVSPYTCRFNTATLANGSYTLRAVATDVAGTVATSATVTNIVIDNTVSSVSLADPGAFLRGTVSLAANTAAGSGIISVAIQRAPAGASTWTTVCTITTSPYSCLWNSATVSDGLYDFRAVLVDGAGKTTISTTVTNRQVDNTLLRGADIQAFNGAGTAGRLDTGDVITYTFTDIVSLATVSPGWNGSALAVSVRLQDGNLLGAGSADDFVDVLRTGSRVNLGSVNLRSDFVKNNKNATFAGTMTASTTTLNGVTVTVVRVTLGALTSGGSLKTSTALVASSWSPSFLVTDSFGNASSAAPVAETGTLDRDF